MGHDGILFCNLDIMIYNINITRNGIVNCNFTDVLHMLTVHNSQQTTIHYATVLSNPGRFARGSFRRVVSPRVVSPLFYGWVVSPLLGGSFRP